MNMGRLRESVLGVVGDAAQNCPLPRHILALPKRSLTDRIEAGSFYEIDPTKLPDDAPPVLSTLRVVLVSTKTEQGVTIRYPSFQSIETFFTQRDSLPFNPEYPVTDKIYVMVPEVAVQVIGHKILSQDFVANRKYKSFWVMNCPETEQPALPAMYRAGPAVDYGAGPAAEYGAGRAADFNAKNGICFSILQRCGMKWGSRHTQKVIQPDDADEAISALSHGDDEEIVEGEESHEVEMKTEEEIHEVKIVKEEEVHEVENVKEEEVHEVENVKEEDSQQVEVKAEETPEVKVKEIIQYSRKRKRARPVRSQYRTRHSVKRKPLEIIPKVEGNEGDRVDRWSAMRYEAAVKQLVQVLKANKAFYGHPITRATLRIEARKKVGDTGLLDHLLKHLAGKVVPSGGDERLRRRCDPDGKMVYWLESADLVNIRKEAGIKDPYWTPPPGWKRGDCIISHDCICCKEVRLLKDELNDLRRKATELKFKDEKQQAITVVPPESAASSGRFSNADLNVMNSKDSYELLVKKKSAMEEQLHMMSKALIQLEEDMKKFSSKAEAEVNPEPLMISYPKSLTAEEMNEMNISSTEDLAQETSEESSESDDEDFEEEKQVPKILMPIRLRACRTLYKISNATCDAVVSAGEDLMSVTPLSASPHSTTTS